MLILSITTCLPLISIPSPSVQMSLTWNEVPTKESGGLPQSINILEGLVISFPVVKCWWITALNLSSPCSRTPWPGYNDIPYSYLYASIPVASPGSLSSAASPFPFCQCEELQCEGCGTQGYSANTSPTLAMISHLQQHIKSHPDHAVCDTNLIISHICHTVAHHLQQLECLMDDLLCKNYPWMITMKRTAS